MIKKDQGNWASMNPEKNTTVKLESVEAFLARGGSIKKVPPLNGLLCLESIDRMHLVNVITKFYGSGKKADTSKLYRTCCKVLDRVRFDMAENYEIKVLKNFFKALGFELSVNMDHTYYLKKNKETKDEPEATDHERIAQDMKDLFFLGHSLRSVQSLIKRSYGLDFDPIEIAAVIDKESL